MNLGPFRRLSSFGRLPSRVRARVGVVGLAVDPSWCGDDRVVGAVDPEALVTFDLPRPSVVVVAGWDANIATFVARAARPAVIVVSDDPAASQGWANERCRVAERPEDVGRHLSTLIREEWRFFLEPSEILRWYAHDVRNALFAPSMATDELRTAEVITGDLAEDVEAIDEGIRRTLGMTYAMSALGVSWARTRVKPQPAQVGLAGTFEDAAAWVGIHPFLDAAVPFDLVVQVHAGPPNAAGPFDLAVQQLMWLVKLQLKVGATFSVDARANGSRVEVEITWRLQYPMDPALASHLLDRATVLELKHRDVRTTPMGLSQLAEVVRDLDGEISVTVDEDRMVKLCFDLPRAGG